MNTEFKFLLMPDSFKGSLTAQQFCSTVSSAVQAHFAGAQVISVPIADGGEGTCAAMALATGGSMASVRVAGPYFEPCDAQMCFFGSTAVIEMAACASLPMVRGRLNPEATTTYGVGELIKHALDSGVSSIILGLGGSCTNDGGCGMAAALGVRFYNSSGQFVPVGGTLCDIRRIDLSGVDKRLKATTLRVMCDIDNPLYGPQGAAYVFAPQKGADAQAVTRLDNGLRHLAKVLLNDTGIDVSCVAGGGAAGGMGAGAYAFLGGRLEPGINVVLDTVGFERLCKGATCIITGEGRIDGQSLRGKAVVGVARRAKAAGVPVIALVGSAGEELGRLHDEGITAILPICNGPITLEQSMAQAQPLLYNAANELLSIISRFMQ